jgi:hypothetical protein
VFKSKALFIVGAGASHEVKLPIGTGLKQKIADRLYFYFDGGYQTQGDRRIWEAIQQHILADKVDQSRNHTPYLNAGRHISAAMPQSISIDNFLDAHRGNKHIELCGKLGIVSAILEAEKESDLYFDPFKDQKFPREVNAWFTPFFQRLTEGVAREDIDNIFENVSFITFNYDRCIEHYLINALKIYYGIDDARAETILSRLSIHHPYGKVGALPWQREQGATVPFGGDRNGFDNLLSLSRQIKTFTEQVEGGEDLAAVKAHITNAETIVFLGFAFADQNVALLKPEGGTRAKNVYATAYKVSASDGEVIEALVGDLLGRERGAASGKFRNVDIVIRRDLTCSELFTDYWRSMTR